MLASALSSSPSVPATSTGPGVTTAADGASQLPILSTALAGTLHGSTNAGTMADEGMLPTPKHGSPSPPSTIGASFTGLTDVQKGEFFQNITTDARFQAFSQDELRSADYAQIPSSQSTLDCFPSTTFPNRSPIQLYVHLYTSGRLQTRR